VAAGDVAGGPVVGLAGEIRRQRDVTSGPPPMRLVKINSGESEPGREPPWTDRRATHVSGRLSTSSPAGISAAAMPPGRTVEPPGTETLLGRRPQRSPEVQDVATGRSAADRIVGVPSPSPGVSTVRR
jgi:hypothetical protein